MENIITKYFKIKIGKTDRFEKKRLVIRRLLSTDEARYFEYNVSMDKLSYNSGEPSAGREAQKSTVEDAFIILDINENY